MMAYFYFSSFSHKVLVVMNMQKHFLFLKKVSFKDLNVCVHV